MDVPGSISADNFPLRPRLVTTSNKIMFLYRILDTQEQIIGAGFGVMSWPDLKSPAVLISTAQILLSQGHLHSR